MARAGRGFVTMKPWRGIERRQQILELEIDRDHLSAFSSRTDRLNDAGACTLMRSGRMRYTRFVICRSDHNPSIA